MSKFNCFSQNKQVKVEQGGSLSPFMKFKIYNNGTFMSQWAWLKVPMISTFAVVE